MSHKPPLIILMSPDRFWLQGAKSYVCEAKISHFRFECCFTLSALRERLLSARVAGVLTTLNGEGEMLHNWFAFSHWYKTLMPELRPVVLCMTDLNISSMPDCEHFRTVSSRMSLAELMKCLVLMKTGKERLAKKVGNNFRRRQVTFKEMTILHLLATGFSIYDVSKKLNVPVKQVGVYKWRALTLLGMNSIAVYIRLSKQNWVA